MAMSTVSMSAHRTNEISMISLRMPFCQNMMYSLCSASKSWAAIKRIDLNEFENGDDEIFRAQQEQRLLAKARIANIYGIYHDAEHCKLYKVVCLPQNGPFSVFDHRFVDIAHCVSTTVTISRCTK